MKVRYKRSREKKIRVDANGKPYEYKVLGASKALWNRMGWGRNGRPPLECLLDWYDAFLRSPTPKHALAALGLTSEMHQWMRYPELDYATRLAQHRRNPKEGGQTLANYIFKHLSSEAQKVWQECEFYREHKNATAAIDAILKGKSVKLRQELFLHALVHNAFDYSSAMEMVHVSRGMFDNWTHDLEFRRLLEEIQWHKKNFFEHCLVDLVGARHPGAVLFVNRTVNAARGYGEKMEVKHSNEGIRLEELDLDLDTKRKILDAVRRKQKGIQVGGDGKLIDVESAVTEGLSQLPAIRE